MEFSVPEMSCGHCTAAIKKSRQGSRSGGNGQLRSRHPPCGRWYLPFAGGCEPSDQSGRIRVWTCRCLKNCRLRIRF